MTPSWDLGTDLTRFWVGQSIYPGAGCIAIQGASRPASDGHELGAQRDRALESATAIFQHVYVAHSRGSQRRERDIFGNACKDILNAPFLEPGAAMPGDRIYRHELRTRLAASVGTPSERRTIEARARDEFLKQRHSGDLSYIFLCWVRLNWGARVSSGHTVPPVAGDLR